MKRLADRRTLLLAAATAAVAATAGADTTRPADIEVTIGFEGGEFIPKGELLVYLDGPAGGRPPAAGTNAESDGRSRKMSVFVPLPADGNTPSPRQIVARLQRADGWLLARGSARLGAGKPAFITLSTVMY